MGVDERDAPSAPTHDVLEAQLATGATTYARPAEPALHAARRRRSAVLRRALASADVLAAVAAVTVAALMGGAVSPLSALVLAPSIVVAAKIARLYDRDDVRLRKSTLEEVPALFQLAGICVLVMALVEGQFARDWVAVLWLTLFAAMAVFRLAARAATMRAVALERCIVVGDPVSVPRIAERVRRRRGEIVAYVPLVDGAPADETLPGAPDPGQALGELLESEGADRVIFALGQHADGEATLAMISRAQELGVRVSILPRMFEVIGSSVEFDHVDGLIMLGVHPFGLSRSSRLVKRAVDVVGAAALLTVAGPFMLLAALAIRLESPGSPLFRQTRVGRDGRPFTILKFRSMYTGADATRAALAALSHAGDGLFKVRDDPRITRVGALLRRYSLDELPQLLNVVRGDMSLVGPRPLILEEDGRIEGRHRRRLHLAPGMTGPWQILGDSEHRVPLRDMVTIDYLYAANWSLWTDVKILLRTIVHVCGGRGL